MTLNPWAWVQTQIEKTRHPVGYIFEFDPTGLDGAPDLTTPEKVAEYFGYGVWARYGDGRVTVGVVDGKYAAGATGGEENVALTGVQNGPHSHSFGTVEKGQNVYVEQWDWTVTANQIYDAAGFNSYGMRTHTDGEGMPHNNMQPYVVVYRWRRVA